MAAHQGCLRRVMRGCLLSRKVRVLRALLELKNAAHRFAFVSARLSPRPDAHTGPALDPATGVRSYSGCLAAIISKLDVDPCVRTAPERQLLMMTCA